MQSMFKPTQGLMIPFCIPNWILTQELLTQSAETGGRRNTKLSTRRGTRDPQQGARGSGRMARRCSVSARHGQRAPSSSVTAAVSSRAVTAPARRWWAEWRRIAWASAATSAWGHRLRPAGTRICTLGALITDQQTQRTAGVMLEGTVPQKRCSRGVTSISNRDLISAERHYIVIYVK